MSEKLLPASLKPLITVVLATRGDNLTSLKRCLESLQKQTFKNFEVILVYSIQTNELMDLCKAYNITAMKEVSKTLASARNLGIQHARGCLITFTDDDCELPEKWLETIYKRFQQYSSLSCLGGPDLNPPRRDNYFRSALGSFEESRRKNLAFDRSAVAKIKGANVTYRKDVFEKVGYLNASLKYWEDSEYHIRLAEKGCHLRFDPEVFVWHNRRETLIRALRHIATAGSGAAPMFLSWKVFKYSRYESMIASYYLTIFLFPLTLLVYFLNPNFIETTVILGFVAFITSLGYTIFTIVRVKEYNIKEIFYIPILIILTSLARWLGFYSGLIIYVFNTLKGPRALG